MIFLRNSSFIFFRSFLQARGISTYNGSQKKYPCFYRSLKNDGKDDGKSSVVLVVNSDQMDRNIPNDVVLGKTSHIGIQVLSQMFKGYGEIIWDKIEKTLEKKKFAFKL